MAYIVNVTQTATSVAATYTVTLGEHASGDLLLVKVSQDGGGTTIAPDATSSTAGWQMIGTQAASGASRSAWAYLIADSAAEVNPVFTGANDDWIGTCLVIRDAHATAPFGASPTSAVNYIRTDWNNVSSTGCGTLTPPEDECLLIYSWNADGSNQYMRCKLNEVTAADKYATTVINHIIGYRQQQTAASTAGSATMYNINATEGGNGWVLAVRNKSGGALQPDIRPDITELKWHGSWEAPHDSITWQAPSNFAATINSITCSSTVPTTSITNSQPQTTWGVSTGLASSENTAGSWVGGTFTISSTNMTGKIAALQYSVSAASTSSLSGSDGVILCFSDGTNWVAYQVVTKSKGWFANFEDTAFIALGNATAYASSGSINWAAVTRLGYFVHRTGSATTTVNLFCKAFALFGTTAITGGGSSRPASFQDYQSAMNSWGTWLWAELNASSQVKAKSSVQVGDGTNKTYFDGAAQSFEFPQAWSATAITNWQMSWNVASNSVGLSVKAKNADVVNIASGVAATDTLQNLSVNSLSAAAADATYSFAQSFVGWLDPIDNKGLTWIGATFKECGTVTIAGGGDMTNCTIASTASANAALSITANGTTLDGCTIDGTGAAYALELGTSVTAITLTDCAITAGSTDKVHVLATTGTVTITISGTTSLVAGDVTSAGATVVISAPVTYQSVTISNVVSGSRVQIYDTTNSVELCNGTASNSASGTGKATGATVVSGSPATFVWTDNVAASTSGARDIRVRVAYVSGTTAKSFIEAAIGTVAASGSGVAIAYRANQVADTTYNSNAVDGSAVTGITIVEGSTDRVQISIAGGSVSWAQIYAYQCWWLFDSVGITDDGAFIEAPDTANYILTGFKIKNTHASIPLLITGGYGVDSTGSVSALYDTTGTSIFPAPAHVVPYATGSGVTPSDITDIASASATAAATAVWGDSKALTVPKFLGLK